SSARIPRESPIGFRSRSRAVLPSPAATPCLPCPEAVAAADTFIYRQSLATRPERSWAVRRQAPCPQLGDRIFCNRLTRAPPCDCQRIAHGLPVAGSGGLGITPLPRQLGLERAGRLPEQLQHRPRAGGPPQLDGHPPRRAPEHAVLRRLLRIRPPAPPRCAGPVVDLVAPEPTGGGFPGERGLLAWVVDLGQFVGGPRGDPALLDGRLHVPRERQQCEGLGDRGGPDLEAIGELAGREAPAPHE